MKKSRQRKMASDTNTHSNRGCGVGEWDLAWQHKTGEFQQCDLCMWFSKSRDYGEVSSWRIQPGNQSSQPASCHAGFLLQLTELLLLWPPPRYYGNSEFLSNQPLPCHINLTTKAKKAQNVVTRDMNMRKDCSSHQARCRRAWLFPITKQSSWYITL